jgi:hypothetical protein
MSFRLEGDVGTVLFMSEPPAGRLLTSAPCLLHCNTTGTADTLCVAKYCKT